MVSGGRDHRVILWACGLHGDWGMMRVFRGHEEILHFVAQDEDRWGQRGYGRIYGISLAPYFQDLQQR